MIDKGVCLVIIFLAVMSAIVIDTITYKHIEAIKIFPWDLATANELTRHMDQCRKLRRWADLVRVYVIFAYGISILLIVYVSIMYI